MFQVSLINVTYSKWTAEATASLVWLQTAKKMSVTAWVMLEEARWLRQTETTPSKTGYSRRAGVRQEGERQTGWDRLG